MRFTDADVMLVISTSPVYDNLSTPTTYLLYAVVQHLHDTLELLDDVAEFPHDVLSGILVAVDELHQRVHK